MVGESDKSAKRQDASKISKVGTDVCDMAVADHGTSMCFSGLGLCRWSFKLSSSRIATTIDKCRIRRGEGDGGDSGRQP